MQCNAIRSEYSRQRRCVSESDISDIVESDSTPASPTPMALEAVVGVQPELQQNQKESELASKCPFHIIQKQKQKSTQIKNCINFKSEFKIFLKIQNQKLISFFFLFFSFHFISIENVANDTNQNFIWRTLHNAHTHIHMALTMVTSISSMPLDFAN